MKDRASIAIRWSTVVAVTLVAGIAGWASYEHAYMVVSAHGESGMVGRVYPGTIDGLIFAASMVLLDSARRRITAPKLARWLLAAGITATLAANVAAGIRYGVLGAVVAAWPAPALVGSYELLMWLVRTAAAQVAQGPAAGMVLDAGSEPAPAVADIAGPVSVTSAVQAAGEHAASAAGPSARGESLPPEARTSRRTRRKRASGQRMPAADREAAVLTALAAEPELTHAELARRMGCDEATIRRVRKNLVPVTSND